MRPATNFEQRLRNVYHLLSSNTAPDPRSSLYHAIAALGAFCPTLTRDVEKTRRVLELGGALRMATGPGRQVGEERLLQLLSGLAYECCLMVQEARKKSAPDAPPTQESPADPHEPMLVLRALAEFALGSLHFQRPRDAFGARRRGAAFSILSRIAHVMELPDALSLATAALRKPRSPESLEAAQFIETYLLSRHLTADDEIVDRLLKLSEVTPSRATATTALEALVKIGAISDSEAWHRLDDWKQQHV